MTLLLLFVPWIAAFAILWLAGRRLTRMARAGKTRLTLVAAGLAATVVVPVIAAVAFPNLAFPAASVLLLAFAGLGLQLRLVRPIERFAGDRPGIPLCTDAAVVDAVGRISASLRMPPPPVFQWNSMTGSLAALAFTYGLQAPSIVVTDGIIHRLSGAERDAVLAHELAHLARRTLRILALLTPVAALVGLALSPWTPGWVALSGMFAAYVLLRTLLGRRDEVACDLLGAGVVGFPAMVAALDKIHAAHAIAADTKLAMLAHAVATHPHRVTRLTALRDRAPQSDRALIPDESSGAARHRKAALVARTCQFLAFGAAVFLARAAPLAATAIFLALTLLPLSLIIAAARRRTRNLRRLLRFPPVAGTATILAGLAILAASVLMPWPEQTGLAPAASLIGGLLVLLAGVIRMAPVRQRRQAVAVAFGGGDYAATRRLAAEKPVRARRDPVVRHTSAFAAALLGERDVAIAELVAINQEHPKALGSLIAAASLEVHSHPDRALELAENVSRALPEDPTALLLAARALRRLGRIPEAVERIARARTLEPDDGRLPAFHACLAVDQGDVEKARALVAEAERLAPGDVWPALARAELALRTEPADRVQAALAAARASVNAHPIAFLGDEITSLTSRAS